MKKCRFWRKRIPEAIYGELEPKTREEMERHFAACDGCAALYEGMAAAVRKMEARPAPDRPPRYWEGYWARLEARMTLEMEASERDRAGKRNRLAGEPRRWRRGSPIPAWAYSAAGALMLVSLGIFIGRTLLRPRMDLSPLARTTSTEAAPGGQPGLGTGSVEPALALRASRYLKRSRTLLLAVVNSDPKAEEPFRLNLPLQKRTSEELLSEAAVLKKGLRRTDPRLERLISDLETILLQIANLASDSDDSAIEIIRAGVEGQDILFKINLNESLRPARKPGRGPSPGSGGENRNPARAKTATKA
jgi:hypothetical protein